MIGYLIVAGIIAGIAFFIARNVFSTESETEYAVDFDKNNPVEQIILGLLCTVFGLLWMPFLIAVPTGAVMFVILQAGRAVFTSEFTTEVDIFTND